NGSRMSLLTTQTAESPILPVVHVVSTTRLVAADTHRASMPGRDVRVRAARYVTVAGRATTTRPTTTNPSCPLKTAVSTGLITPECGRALPVRAGHVRGRTTSSVSLSRQAEEASGTYPHRSC